MKWTQGAHCLPERPGKSMAWEGRDHPECEGIIGPLLAMGPPGKHCSPRAPAGMAPAPQGSGQGPGARCTRQPLRGSPAFAFSPLPLFKKKIIHLAACGLCGGTGGRVPRPGIEPRPPALGARQSPKPLEHQERPALASSRGLLHVLLGEFTPRLEVCGEKPKGFSKLPEEEERPSEREGRPGGRSKRAAGRAAVLAFTQVPVVHPESS